MTISDPGGFYELWHRRRLELARQHFNPNSKIALDVGCGYGFLKSMGLAQVVGIDISPSSGVTVFASAEYLPFRDEVFDLVFAGEVIEHLWKPALALTEWVRVLSIKGNLVISTPNGRLIRLEGNNPAHKKMFDAPNLSRFLNSIGIEAVTTKGIFVGFLSGRRVFSLLPLRWLKILLVQFPVPPSLSFDLFIVGTRKETFNETKCEKELGRQMDRD